jgi:hypothetical protein
LIILKLSGKETEMRISALIVIALLSVPAHAAKVTTFNKECVENEATIVSLQPQPKQEALVIEGEACDRGQLTKEDLSYVESVQPANAVRVIRGAK